MGQGRIERASGSRCLGQIAIGNSEAPVPAPPRGGWTGQGRERRAPSGNRKVAAAGRRRFELTLGGLLPHTYASALFRAVMAPSG